MSIDHLISQLEMEEKDLGNVQESVQEILSDYIGISDAYVGLMQSFQDDSSKINTICQILKQLLENIEGLSEFNQLLKNEDKGIEFEKYMGLLLSGEQKMEFLIQEFDQIDALE